jgi:hypothetical protein
VFSLSFDPSSRWLALSSFSTQHTIHIFDLKIPTDPQLWHKISQTYGSRFQLYLPWYSDKTVKLLVAFSPNTPNNQNNLNNTYNPNPTLFVVATDGFFYKVPFNPQLQGLLNHDWMETFQFEANMQPQEVDN